MNLMQQTISDITGTPLVPEKWLSHNCKCCVHNGQPREDTRSRGGVRYDSVSGSIAFSCFNCGYKVTWTPGMYLTRKLKSFLEWYGANTTQIVSLTLLAQEFIEQGYKVQSNETNIFEKITPHELPSEAKLFSDIADSNAVPNSFLKVLNSINYRNPNLLQAFELYWSPDETNEMHQRFIIPFFMNGRIVGYTARHTNWAVKEKKYINGFPPNLIYNFDLLNDPKIKDIYVTEGPIDAGLIGGVGLNNFTMKQNQIIHLKKAQENGKNIIVVPDRDKNGKQLFEQALQNGFSVALPQWGTRKINNLDVPIKDIEECTRIYGRIPTLMLLKKYTYTQEFEARVLANKWFL